MPTAYHAISVHEQLQLSLYQVARTPYKTLQASIQHQHWALSHVLQGDVQTMTSGECFSAPAGTVMVHPPGLPYTEAAATPGIHEWIVFDAMLQPHLDLLRHHPVSLIVPLTAPQIFSQTFERLLQTWQAEASDFRTWRAVSLVTQMLDQLLESWRQAGMSPRAPKLMMPQDRFTSLIHYMAAHLDQKLLRDDLARRVRLHPGYFDRVFRETYGIAPMRMLRDLRLQRAKQLLENTDATLETIAAQCGFEDAAYFSRVFRKAFAQAPGQYRQSVKSAINSYRTPLSDSAPISYSL